MEDFRFLNVLKLHPTLEITFAVMGVSSTLPIFYLYDIPKKYYSDIEEKVEGIISHETLHLVIAKLESKKVSKKFDNIFGLYSNFEESILDG